MNAMDVLKYGHLTVLHTLDGLPQTAWDLPGVCGRWSVTNIVGHLASYEWVLVDVLNETLGRGPTVCLDELRRLGPEEFNQVEVEQRWEQTSEQALAEYEAAYAAAQEQAALVSAALLREAGRLPWYGMEYSLDDLIVYQYYGHKREHMAQVSSLRDRLERPASQG